MSGHSKWSTIKRQKGVTDAKRGQLFTKLSKAITIAVHQGGGVTDPTSNPRLRLAIDTARSANMPKDNIDRAIQRAIAKQAQDMEEITYEGFGPGGFSVIIEAITDNKQRTTPEIKSKFEKLGGNLGIPGSVSYLFQQKGMITVKKNTSTFDDIFLQAIEAGAEDVEDADEDVLVYTKPEDVSKVREVLAANGLAITQIELTRTPVTLIQLTDEDAAKKAISFTEKLEEHDDVQKLYANYDISDSLLKTIM